MTDVHDPQIRSYNMSQIKGKDTKPEIIMRKTLWAEGYRYKLHHRKLPGKPDIVFPGRKKVIFINGCFWHKHDCQYFKWPKSNVQFWETKINQNVIRDKKNYQTLADLGWQSLIVWGCEFKKDNFEKLIAKVKEFLDKGN